MALTAAEGAEAARRTEDAVDLAAFYVSHFDLVWRLLVRFGAPAEELEDLTQDVFAIAHRKLPTFRGDSSVVTWLFSVCRKVAAGARRRARVRRVVLELFGLEARANSIQPQPGVRHDLERLLAKLPEVQRLTLLLYEVDGMSAAEIATLFGCPDATVWSRLRLAREELARLCAAERGGGR